jgi:putative colanic acid biosynthesis acetyltransferase WcaF
MSERPRDRLSTKQQAHRFASPWSIRDRAAMGLFRVAWLLLCRWTPKVAKRWRNAVLRLFGARIEGRPFVHPSCIVRIPWQLTLEDRACLGPHVEVYNLGPCILRARCTVSQHVYLCGGTHDLAHAELPLVTGPIEIGRECFVGAKAMLLPGVRIGEGAVVGAAAVVTRDVEPWAIVAGNPARTIGARQRAAPTPVDPPASSV